MKIALLGDTHGDLKWTATLIDACVKSEADLAIQLGDFASFGAERTQYLQDVETLLSEAGLTLMYLDGNHDQVDILTQRSNTQAYTESEHIFYLPRGYRWTWGNTSFMSMGGAHSIDKHYRTNYIDWFKEEEITLGQLYSALEDTTPIDILFSHDAPWGAKYCYGPADSTLPQNNVYPDAMNNRVMLRTLVDTLRPKVVYHGHVHHRYSEYVKTDWGSFKSEGLSHNYTLGAALMIEIDD